MSGETPAVERRSVLRSIGAVTGSAAIAHRASGTVQDGSVTPLSTLQVAEVQVQYAPNEEADFLHVDQFTSYGVDQREDTLGIISPEPSVERVLRSGSPVVIGNGVHKLPHTVNNGHLSELPISTSGLVSNEYLPVEKPVSIPAVAIKTSRDESIEFTSRGKSATVGVGEEVTLSLSPKGVETTPGDQFTVTPEVRVVNYGQLRAKKVTE